MISAVALCNSKKNCVGCPLVSICGKLDVHTLDKAIEILEGISKAEPTPTENMDTMELLKRESDSI